MSQLIHELPLAQVAVNGSAVALHEAGKDLTYQALAVGLVLHTFFPRYDWKTVEQTGSISIVVYDKWTGRMQRAVYDDKGALTVMRVYVPF